MFNKSPAVYIFTLVCAVTITPAQATQRASVASYGNDANICSSSSPCRTFAKAVTVVDPNGEVIALDSAGFGAVTLTQSISLTAAPGAVAGVTVFSGAGITIATPGVNVVLRGLTINSQGGATGVSMTAGAKLSIENCVISNFSSVTQRGIFVNTPATVRIGNTLVRDSDIGVEFQGGATADISGSQFLGNGNGILATSTAGTITAVTISDTIVTGGINGIEAFSSTSGTSRIDMMRATVTDNAEGVKTSASSGIAKITLSDSMVTGNGIGISWPSGTLNTLVNNTVTDNITNASPALGAPNQIPLM